MVKFDEIRPKSETGLMSDEPIPAAECIVDVVGRNVAVVADGGEGEDGPAVAHNAPVVVAHDEEAAAVGGASPSAAAAAEGGAGIRPVEGSLVKFGEFWIGFDSDFDKFVQYLFVNQIWSNLMKSVSNLISNQKNSTAEPIPGGGRTLDAGEALAADTAAVAAVGTALVVAAVVAGELVSPAAPGSRPPPPPPAWRRPARAAAPRTVPTRSGSWSARAPVAPGCK